MSQPSYGRGRGRAMAHDAKKSASTAVPSTSGSSMSRGPGCGAAPETAGASARRNPETEGENVSSIMTQLSSMTSELRLGGPKPSGGDGNNGSKTLGRGGLRGTRRRLLETIKTRPEMCASKMGTTGTPVQLMTNYFKLETMANWVIFQYRVDFNIEEELHSMKKKWLREHADRLGHAYIFDGSALFTSRRLTPPKKPLSLISIRESDNTPVQIEIRFVQELNFGHIIYLQVFNILVRRALSCLKLQLVNRNYFDPTAAIRVPQYNLEIWPGYVTSIRQNESSILMCSEIAHKIMRLDSALDLLAECAKQTKDYRTLFQQSIIGQVVLTGYNNKTYRIDDVDFSVTPRSKFKLKNDEEISYIEYYEKRYRIRIRDLQQPLLVSRSSARSIRAGLPVLCLLVPELCRMTGLSERMLENNQLKKGLSEFTRIGPEERIKRLMNFNRRLLNCPEIVNEFKHWDMKISTDLVTVTGRELPFEKILDGNGQYYSAGFQADWTRELRSRPMLKNGRIAQWVVICPRQLKGNLVTFLDALRRAASGMNFSLPSPQIFETLTDKPAHLVEALEDAIGKLNLDLVMFICSNNRSDRYNAIKKKCIVDRGIPSQVVLGRSLMGKGLSIATKVAIQMNCKIGGAPWSVELPLKNIMVVGYDACHDTYSKGKTFGAMVASLNNALSSWFSAVSHHGNGEELSDTLSLDICKALRKYKEINGTLPSRIIVYRDGVGEGQIPYVYEHEVRILKSRLSQVYCGDEWKLAYILVTKRINTRLFKSNRNPVAGTVVDDVITLPERYDFYLVSQNVNIGTVTPTNYNVISDNLGLKPDQIQRWTYKMTHLYYNWSGTVRVPAPCQYAHKLAFLVSQSLHMEPHPHLETTLHFL